MTKVPKILLGGFIGVIIMAAAAMALLFPESIFPVLIGLGFVLGLSVAVLRDPVIGALAVIFFLPFERLPTATLFDYTVKINHAVGALLLVAWGLHLLLGRASFSKPRTIPWGILLFLSLGISAYYAHNQTRAWAILLFIGFAQLLGQAVMHLVQNRLLWERVIRVLVVSVGIVVVFALYQFFGDLVGIPHELTGLDPGYTKAVFGFPRVQAFSKEPLYLANYLFIPLGIFTALLVGRVRFSAPKGFIALYLLALLVFVLTLSRGAFVGAIAFLFVFAVLEAKNLFSSRVLLTTFWSIAFGVLILFAVFSRLGEGALERFVGHATVSDFRVSQSGESIFGRLKAFGQAYDAWKGAPAFGIGPGNFGPYVEGYPAQPKKEGWDIVNNQYLELLAEGGAAGIAIFLWYVIVTFLRALRALYHEHDSFRRALLVGLVAALAAVLVQYNFFSTLYIIHVWVLFGLLGAVTQWSLRTRGRVQQ